MTSATYLEHYLDGLENLPTDLQRNFKLMKELDTRAQSLMKTIDQYANEIMRSMAKDKDGMPEDQRKEKLKNIQEMFNKAKEYGDDKVQLAIQTYELVDKHIRRLDSDLARFEGEIQDKTITARSKAPDETVGKSKKGRKKVKDTKTPGKKKRNQSSEDEAKASGSATVVSQKGGRKQKVNQEKETRKGVKKNAEPEDNSMDIAEQHPTHPSDVLDMPVDPNEPTYCLCQRVSYGEMIGCDNVDCPMEWFHFACVGLISKPKGKWFCPKCSQDRKKK